LFVERALPRKAKQKARAHLVCTEEEEDMVSSDYEGENEGEEEPDEFEDQDKTYGTERSKKSVLGKKRPRAPRYDVVEDDLKQTVGHIGVDAEEIVKLINNEETKESIIRKTGFSPNYVMKLQRRVLRASPGTVPYSSRHMRLTFFFGSATATPLARAQGAGQVAARALRPPRYAHVHLQGAVSHSRRIGHIPRVLEEEGER
jgi:hypothetical protein